MVSARLLLSSSNLAPCVEEWLVDVTVPAVGWLVELWMLVASTRLAVKGSVDH